MSICSPLNIRVWHENEPWLCLLLGVQSVPSARHCLIQSVPMMLAHQPQQDQRQKKHAKQRNRLMKREWQNIFPSPPLQWRSESSELSNTGSMSLKRRWLVELIQSPPLHAIFLFWELQGMSILWSWIKCLHVPVQMLQKGTHASIYSL